MTKQLFTPQTEVHLQSLKFLEHLQGFLKENQFQMFSLKLWDSPTILLPSQGDQNIPLLASKPKPRVTSDPVVPALKFIIHQSEEDKMHIVEFGTTTPICLLTEELHDWLAHNGVTNSFHENISQYWKTSTDFDLIFENLDCTSDKEDSSSQASKIKPNIAVAFIPDVDWKFDSFEYTPGISLLQNLGYRVEEEWDSDSGLSYAYEFDEKEAAYDLEEICRCSQCKRNLIIESSIRQASNVFKYATKNQLSFVVLVISNELNLSSIETAVVPKNYQCVFKYRTVDEETHSSMLAQAEDVSFTISVWRRVLVSSCSE